MSETTPEPEAVVSVEALSHTYKRTHALAGVSFTVTQGSIHGFVGPNGAGKTTTLSILATLLRPQTGTVRVFGHRLPRDYKAVRRRIGFMPDHLGLYAQMTVFECLDFFAAAYGMKARRRESVIDDVLTLTDMIRHKDSLVKSLSRGMSQRVSLARALVHDPDLLLLDEPASGLDPRARVELLEVLRELSRMGKTIFISSHILGELGDLCDHVTIIDRGRPRYSGTMRGLLARRGDVAAYVLTLEDAVPGLAERLAGQEGIAGIEQSDGEAAYKLSFDTGLTSANAVLRAAMDAGARVVSFREDLRQLTDVFMEL
ncbi:MAG: ABC transporter ATP-binding protein, partial [Candidatus Brocadiaceae bacterium]|nr:ABC transporter ATP-binding protein [Candidatus Brocadiaceae bacterium]